MTGTVRSSLTPAVFWTFGHRSRRAILAVPLTPLAKALLFDVDASTRWMSSLLDAGPAPAGGDADETAPSEAPSSAGDDQIDRVALPQPPVRRSRYRSRKPNHRGG